jgi:crossover junction endodeoxyribonuclease RusA
MTATVATRKRRGAETQRTVAASVLPLDLYVVGTPRPKGSMRHVGKGRMVEQIKASPDWRLAVKDVAHARVRCACPDLDCHTLLPGFPYDAPVAVEIWLWFARPASAKKGAAWPSSRHTGDIDKHARNILDALQDAGVLKDDARAVDLNTHKRYCGPDETPGARIVIKEIA